ASTSQRARKRCARCATSTCTAGCRPTRGRTETAAPRSFEARGRGAYLGSPPGAVEPLRALGAAGDDVAMAVTNADKRRGRGASLVPTPVKATATELGLPVTDRVDDLLALDPLPELGVVVAFGRLIKPHVFEPIPMINLHFSRLPRWRGAAPVEWAILSG